MSKRETELLMVFRELCGCELFAPESCFHGDRLVKQGKAAVLAEDTSGEVKVPMSSFWRPVSIEDEHLVNPKSEKARAYAIKEKVEEVHKPGQYLGAALQDFQRQYTTAAKTGAQKDKKAGPRSPEADEQPQARP